MRGKSAPECRKSPISPKKSTLERSWGGGQRRTGIKNAGRGRRPLPASPTAIMYSGVPSLPYRDSGFPDMIMDRKKRVRRSLYSYPVVG
jgi:hypothetical protein